MGPLMGPLMGLPMEQTDGTDRWDVPMATQAEAYGSSYGTDRWPTYGTDRWNRP